jgi:hypothetical protein
MYAYDTSDCAVFSQALEYAFAMYMQAGRLTPKTLDFAGGALSYAILDAAAGGQRNPRVLAIAAVANVGRYEKRLRESRSWVRASTAA